MIMGTAKNGEYVKFKNPWPTVPNVIVIPQNMIVQSEVYPSQRVILHAYATNITTNGFNVVCYSGISNASGGYQSLNAKKIDATYDVWNRHWGFYNGDINATTVSFTISLPSNVSAATISGHTVVHTDYKTYVSMEDTASNLLTITCGGNTVYNGKMGS